MNYFRVVVCNLLAFSLALTTPLAIAQSDILAGGEPDLVAPVISVKEVTPPSADNPQIKIVAQAADNIGVATFHLFYRAWGGGSFDSTPFVATRNGFYEVTIAVEKIPSQKLEYYIEATDGSGNIAMHGSSLSPRGFDFSATNIASTADSDPTPQKDGNTPSWKWVVGGIAAAVAIGFLAAGGGNKPEDPATATTSSNPTGTVSVINVPAP